MDTFVNEGRSGMWKSGVSVARPILIIEMEICFQFHPITVTGWRPSPLYICFQESPTHYEHLGIHLLGREVTRGTA